MRPRDEILSACFSDKYVFTSYDDGEVIQFNFSNQSEILNRFEGHTKRISSLFLINKNTLVTGSYDSTIRTWNIQVFNLFTVQNGEPEAVYKTSGPANLVIPGENN